MNGVKVLITIPVLCRGGTEMVTLDLCRALQAHGFDVAVLCFRQYDPEILAIFRTGGITVHLEEGGGSYLSVLGRIRHVIRREQPDVVHVQYMTPGTAPILAARLSGVRSVFATVHQSGRIATTAARCLIRISAALCHRFVSVSEAVQQSWFGAADPAMGKHRRIHNAVDFVAIDTAIEHAPDWRERHQIGADEQILVIAARLHHVKGYAFFIDALAALAADGLRPQVLALGDGPHGDELRAHAETRGVATIRWLGRQARDVVYQHLALADVVVVPSLSEGLGLSAIEALGAGSAVVASDVDGLAEVIADGKTGRLVAYDDVEALAETLKALLQSSEPRQTLAKAGQGDVRDRFSMENFATAHIALYEEHLKERSS